MGTPGDFDSQLRPSLLTFRIRTPWDIGADENPTSGALADPIIPGMVPNDGMAFFQTFIPSIAH